MPLKKFQLTINEYVIYYHMEQHKAYHSCNSFLFNKKR